MATKRKKPKKFSAQKEVRAIARERVGTVKPERAIEPKPERRKVKHKQDLSTETDPELS